MKNFEYKKNEKVEVEAIEHNIDLVIANKKRLIEQYCSSLDAIASYNKKILKNDISILENMKQAGKTTYLLSKYSDNCHFEHNPLFKEFLTSNNTRGQI